MNDVVRRHTVRRFALESGHVLDDVEQAFTLAGELNEARDNLVVVFHSLTGGPNPEAWWPDLVGPGRALDTDRYAVLCPNLLGSCYGTTPLPVNVSVTTRDMARMARLLVRTLEVESVALATGGSLGGMVTLEWAAGFPSLTRSAVAFAAPAAQTAHAIGLNHLQREAVELGGRAGFALARMAAMMTYRSPAELESRFGREYRDDGRFQIQSYLDHHGAKLVRRFDATAYRTLIDAMDTHDVGRGRGGVATALGAFQGALIGVGITGDLLYEPAVVRSWTTDAACEYAEIRSNHGHDAFLLEAEQVGATLEDVLDGAHSTPLSRA